MVASILEIGISQNAIIVTIWLVFQNQVIYDMYIFHPDIPNSISPKIPTALQCDLEGPIVYYMHH